MRKIIEAQPCFMINLRKDQPLVLKYREKYESISELLDRNPLILKRFHQDLCNYGSPHGKGSHFSSEQILRILLVLFIEQLTYRDTIIRVSESDFLRNFCRIGIGKVMSSSFLCGAFKHLCPSTFESINTLLTNYSLTEEKITGTALRLDSTVCASSIHYPTDVHLMYDTYRVLSRLLHQCSKLEPHWNQGYRFHTGKIKKMYVYISTHGKKKNRSTKRKVKRFFDCLIDRVSTICDKASRFIAASHCISTPSLQAVSLRHQLSHFHDLGVRVVTQTYQIHKEKKKVSASDRIYSIFEEHTELLKRGKAGKPVEFGHMVSLGQTKEKFISFYDVRETSLHDIAIKPIVLDAHKEIFESYPEQFVADKNYYESMEDIKSWEKEIPVYAIAKKGNKTEAEYQREQKDSFKLMQKFRAGIEGTISVLKRAFGLNKCQFKGFNSFATAIGCLVFAHNLVLLTRL